jgi:hypothetical protein
MWFTFAAAVSIAIAVLYVPGFLFFRAFGLSRFVSVVVAPGYSVCAFVAAGLALAAAGVSCPAWVLLAIALAVALVACGVGRLVRLGAAGADAEAGASGAAAGTASAGAAIEDANVGERAADSAPAFSRMSSWGASPWKSLGLFVSVSVLVTLVVFVQPMGDPYGFARLDDSAAHLAMVRSFLETGFYSTLSVSGYVDMGGVGGYYPAAWHIYTAIVACVFGESVTLATNATTFVICAMVLPAGLCYLFRQLFGDSKHVLIVACGVVVAVAFSGFPWGFLTWGQLLPNLLSYSLVPGALALLAAAVKPGAGHRAGLPGQITGFVLTAASITLAQPNGIFVLGIWAVVFGVNRAFVAADGISFAASGKRVALAAGIAVAACALWVGLYFAPPLQSVVQYSWKSFISPVQALIAGGAFMFSGRQGVQPFLTALVLLGIVFSFKSRRYLWLTVAFAFAWALWFIDATYDGVLKQFLTGFWYTDYNRTGAMAALFAVPLAAMGFAWALQLLAGLLGKLGGGKLAGTKAGAASLCALLAVMAAVQFAPISVHYAAGSDGGDESDIRAGLVAVRQQFSTRYSWDRIYTAEEQDFVRQVKQAIPEGAVVLNAPNDGSCYCYAVDDLRVFYRRCSTSAFGGSERVAKLLRTKLDQVSNAAEVQEAVRTSGAQYVLLLDAGRGEDATVNSLRYKESDWAGIEGITESTPGFTLVLSQGDMRLYRIDIAS